MNYKLLRTMPFKTWETWDLLRRRMHTTDTRHARGSKGGDYTLSPSRNMLLALGLCLAVFAKYLTLWGLYYPQKYTTTHLLQFEYMPTSWTYTPNSGRGDNLLRIRRAICQICLWSLWRAHWVGNFLCLSFLFFLCSHHRPAGFVYRPGLCTFLMCVLTPATVVD